MVIFLLPKITSEGACSLSDEAGLLVNSAHPAPAFPSVYHTYNAQYFPRSVATDDIKAPERKGNIPPQEPAMSNTEPTTTNPFGIDAQENKQDDVAPQPTEPMIPLSAVQELIRESLRGSTESTGQQLLLHHQQQ